MIQVLHVTNPFQPHDGLIREIGFEGQTIREWLRSYYGPDFEDFAVPTLCQLNGKPIMRAEWDTLELNRGDGLVFITLPGEVVSIIIAIIAVVIAVAVYLLIGDPKIPAETQSPNSVYTLRGQNNRYRPGEPVEVTYGRCRIWPTFISRPYSRYIGNEQYQFSLFCLGQGDYDVHNTFLDDTETSDFGEVEIELCPPGSPVTLVESAVYSALEVANIELLGPNQPEYIGITGPFTLNDFDKPVRRIEVDVSFPQGLYELSNEGRLQSFSVELLFEYREINEDGDPLGSWETLASPEVTRRDNTPQRITYSVNVPLGRYQIRGQRITDLPEDTGVSSMVRWESAKGYAQNVGNFGDVYIIAVKALATNKLNDQTSRSFNVTATRKLATWDPEDGWSARIATRNPVWSFIDCFKASYGAKLTDTYLDLPTLHELAELFETRNDYFDWTFDEPLTVWEVAKTILRVGRATPIPQGSLITAVRDAPTSLVSGVFNQYNIVQGSLTKTLAMFEFQPFDGLKIVYTDADTWKEKEVDCILPGREGLNLDRLKLPGCTDRDRAYREGMYIQSRRELQRKTVIFQTGLEGHIPTYMDLISITHDTVRVGQGGMVLAYNSSTNEMTLSEQVEFGSEYLEHKIALRGDDGAMLGSPITVTPGSLPNKVILATAPPEALDFSADRVPPLYAFGVTDLWSFLGKVVSVRPIDQKTVEITALNYVDGSYAYDDSEATPVPQVEVIRDVSNPVVAWVTVSTVPDVPDRVFVDWLPALGSAGYIVQITYDDVNWSPAGSYPQGPIQLSVNPGTIKVRIAPFALGGNVRYTVSNEFIVGSNISVPPVPSTTTQEAFTGLTVKGKWLAATGAQGYNVELFIPGELTALRTVNAGLSNFVEYTRAQFVADSPSLNSREIEFRVRAFNAGGSSAALVVVQENTLPTAPTGLASGTPVATAYPVTWDASSDTDFLTFKVYASTTMGFTPGPGDLVDTTASPASSITAAVTTYWRVAALDVWGDEETLSDEAVITV